MKALKRNTRLKSKQLTQLWGRCLPGCRRKKERLGVGGGGGEKCWGGVEPSGVRAHSSGEEILRLPSQRAPFPPPPPPSILKCTSLGPAVPLLRMSPGISSHKATVICTRMVTAASSVVGKTWKQPEYHSAEGRVIMTHPHGGILSTKDAYL